jgi:hypothetical protein
VALSNARNRRPNLIAFRNDRCALRRRMLNLLAPTNPRPVIKHQITSKSVGGQTLTSRNHPIQWAVRTAYVRHKGRIVRHLWASERRPFSALFSSWAWTGFWRLQSSCQVRPGRAARVHPSAVSLDRCQAAAQEAFCRLACRTHLCQGPAPYRHVFLQTTRRYQSRVFRPLGQGRWV